MFQEWPYLLGEIWVLLTLAALLGLLAGWLIFGGRRASAGDAYDADALRRDLAACRDASAEKDRLIADLEGRLETLGGGYANENAGEVDALRAALAERDAEITQLQTGAAAAGGLSADEDPGLLRQTIAERESTIADLEAELERCRNHVQQMDREMTSAAPEATAAPAMPLFAEEGAPVSRGTKPAGFDAPRDGLPDNLKLISGVGPKLEQLLNSLGVFHIDQIANWTQDEIDWVDSNLEGFYGRVTRDNWVPQARLLASGGSPEEAARLRTQE